MSEISATLYRLIEAAESTLCLRQRLVPAGFEDELLAEIAALQPPVGVVWSGAAPLLAQALANLWRASEAERPLWMGAVATLLQLARSDFSQVVEPRKRPLEPDTVRYAGARR